MFSRRAVVAGVAASPLLWSAPVFANGGEPKPPTLEELMRESLLLDAALSPDGSRIAVLREHREAGKRIAYIVLAATDAITTNNTQVTLGDYDVEKVEWANEERLLVWLRSDKAADGKPNGMYVYETFVPIPVRRVMALGLDGGNQVVMLNNQAALLNRGFNLSTVIDLLPDDPRGILMQIWDPSRGTFVLHRVDVYTGDSVLVEKGVQATDGWFTQNGVPVLRYDSNARGTTVSLMARAPGETEWKLVRKIRRNEFKKFDDLDVVGSTTEAGVLLVSHRAEGEDFRSIRRFDLRTLEIGEVVLAPPAGRDLDGVFTDENRNLVGAPYVEDRLGYNFVDPKMKGHYKGLNTFFQGQCNVRLSDVDAQRRRFLVRVTGPRQPGAYYLYDREKANIDVIGEQKPWLTQDRLASMEILQVKSRDGQPLTAYLSVPLAKGPRPLIVMPHGGPEMRDSYDFDLWAQFFAAQGWMVLQPNFRGSSGYGKAFAEAGYRRWGDRMQEDVEDCVNQVLADGRVDPKKVAIFGASYGGYAALMGAVRQPNLYRSAVAIAADADLELSLTFTRREDGADSPAYAYWVKNIGDPKTDEAMLKAASPINRISEIKVPIFLIHGSEDKIVTPAQSKAMAKALEKAGKPHDYMVLKGLGHSGWPAETMKEVLEKSAAFIRKGFDA